MILKKNVFEITDASCARYEQRQHPRGFSVVHLLLLGSMCIGNGASTEAFALKGAIFPAFLATRGLFLGGGLKKMLITIAL